MAATQLTTNQLGASSVNSDDLDTTTTGKAILVKLAVGTNISLSSTGVDAGTGIVTINAPVMTNTVGGTVPTPPNNTTTFLRGDGTWAAPAGGGGGISRVVLSVSVNTIMPNVANTDYIYFVTGTVTMTLPTAVGNTSKYTIKNVASGVVSIATTSSQTIDAGTAPITIKRLNNSLDLISDNANFKLI